QKRRGGGARDGGPPHSTLQQGGMRCAAGRLGGHVLRGLDGDILRRVDGDALIVVVVVVLFRDVRFVHRPAGRQPGRRFRRHPRGTPRRASLLGFEVKIKPWAPPEQAFDTQGGDLYGAAP